VAGEGRTVANAVRAFLGVEPVEPAEPVGPVEPLEPMEPVEREKKCSICDLYVGWLWFNACEVAQQARQLDNAIYMHVL
jgi:hypothetical protein